MSKGYSCDICKTLFKRSNVTSVKEVSFEDESKMWIDVHISLINSNSHIGIDVCDDCLANIFDEHMKKLKKNSTC